MPLVLDSERVLGDPYKVKSFPTMFVIGKSGEVEAVHIGAGAGFEKAVAKEIDLLLAGKTRSDFPGAAAAKPRSPAPVEPSAAQESDQVSG